MTKISYFEADFVVNMRVHTSYVQDLSVGTLPFYPHLVSYVLVRRVMSDDFYKGMSEVHDIVYQEIERLQQGLNDVMSVYMDMSKEENDTARELEVAWRVLFEFKERFTDEYDEKMRAVKVADS